MANLFIRTYTFVDGTVAYGSQVESEISNIVTVLNNLNTAATNWGQVSALHATSVPLIADCSSGTQDIADFKNNAVIKASVSSAGVLSLVPTTNQIVLGTTRTITISATQPASTSRTYTLPDAGADATVILSKGTPTMGAALAMGSNKITGLAASTTSGDAVSYGQSAAALTSPVLTTPTLGVASATSINFGDTALANYKEGTWTPTDQSGAGLSLTNNGAVYTRIGRVVFIQMFVAYPVTASGTQIKIGGLPFTVSSTEYRGMVVTSSASGTNAMRFLGGSTNMEMEGISGRGAIANSSVSGAQVFVTGFYSV